MDNATLTRFFAFHFLLPFIIAALALSHLIFLHRTGSRNPLGINSESDKTPLGPQFLAKDLFGAVITLCGLMLVVFLYP